MRKRVAFVIVSSPNSVTPVHFDIEYSLLMQVRGSRKLSIGRYASEAVRRHEVDRYWDGSHGRIEALPEEVATFRLRPGRAVYIPAGTPHWVHNGPDISQSVTFTYFTSATVRENRVEDFNSRLRRFHLNPREPGHSALVDTAKVGAIGLWAAERRIESKIAGSLHRRSEVADRAGVIGRDGLVPQPGSEGPPEMNGPDRHSFGAGIRGDGDTAELADDPLSSYQPDHLTTVGRETALVRLLASEEVHFAESPIAGVVDDGGE